MITEAREAGCAIVATRVGGIPELLEDGAAGVLVPTSDTAQIAAKLRWLLLDSQARGQFAARAQENLQQLSVERVSGEYRRFTSTPSPNARRCSVGRCVSTRAVREPRVSVGKAR